MKYLSLIVLLISGFSQEKPIVSFSLNGEPISLEKGISLSTFEGSYIQVELVKGKKNNTSLPISGDLLIRADNMAAYMHEFENLEEKIYLMDSIRSKTAYKLKKGDQLVIVLRNIESEGDFIYTIPFRK